MARMDNNFCLFSYHVAPVTTSSTNGEFGEWNAFPGGQMPASAQRADISGNDFFGAMTAVSPTAPAPAPATVLAPASGLASADLFDLMAPTQSITSSQSLNFSMNSTQSMSSTVFPQSMSQVRLAALKYMSVLY